MTATATCSICHRPGALLQAGGTVGLCHPACFRRWDRLDEAAVLSQVAFLATLPPAPDRRTSRRAA